MPKTSTLFNKRRKQFLSLPNELRRSLVRIQKEMNRCYEMEESGEITKEQAEAYFDLIAERLVVPT